METETLEPRKIQAIYMLIAGETHALIGKTVGADPRTVRRWMEEPEFSKQLKREYDSVANIIRTHHRAQMLKSGETGLEATRFLGHIMNADGAGIAVRMRAANQLMNYSFKHFAHMQEHDKEEWAKPIAGLHEVEVKEQNRKAIKKAEKAAHAAPPVPPVPERAVPSTPSTQPVANTEPQASSIDELATVTQQDVIQTLLKTGKCGQLRASQTEHLARMKRLKRLEEQLEACTPEKSREVA